MSGKRKADNPGNGPTGKKRRVANADEEQQSASVKPAKESKEAKEIKEKESKEMAGEQKQTKREPGPVAKRVRELIGDFYTDHGWYEGGKKCPWDLWEPILQEHADKIAPGVPISQWTVYNFMDLFYLNHVAWHKGGYELQVFLQVIMDRCTVQVLHDSVHWMDTRRTLVTAEVRKLYGELSHISPSLLDAFVTVHLSPGLSIAPTYVTETRFSNGSKQERPCALLAYNSIKDQLSTENYLCAPSKEAISQARADGLSLASAKGARR